MIIARFVIRTGFGLWPCAKNLRRATPLALLVAVLICLSAPRSTCAQDLRADSTDSGDAGSDHTNPLRQSSGTGAQQIPTTSPRSAPAYQLKPTAGTSPSSDPSLAFLPYAPTDDTQYSPIPKKKSPMRPAMQTPQNGQSTSGPSASGPTTPPANLSPLPTNSSPMGPQMMNGPQGQTQNQMLQGVPSHAAAFPSSGSPQAPGGGNSAESCNNCGPGGAGPNGGPQENQPWGNQTPYMFQPDHYPRALGPGEPLVGTSWQNRPFYVEGFSGTMIGDDAIKAHIGQESGFFIGGRLGWDYDYYWGVESRLGMSWMSLFDKRNPLNDLGNGDIVDWDMALLYYPWGDSKWRPFLLLGTGISQFDTFGGNARGYSATLFELPFGAGMKFHFNEWLAWRFEVIDNLAFGDGTLDTMNNISFTAGLEYHFGGRRRNYWPWNPDPKH